MKAIVMLAAMLLTACPSPTPKSGCTPDETRCLNGRPQLCSPETRWVFSDRPCAEIGAVCCLTPSRFSSNNFHACARQWDCIAASDGGPD